ncbi:MAG: hypothetical protein V3V30_01880 [Parvularculaceae bacterium]
MTTHKIFDDPSWFLSSINADLEVFEFTPVTRTVIRKAAFLDGRTTITVGPDIKTVPLAEALEWIQHKTPAQPNRVIAHISFCGSTLLAKSLEKKGRILSYREPQILVDLANLRAARQSLTRDDTTWRQIIRFTLSQFRKSWEPEEASVLKPSNWVNNMLMDMLTCGDPLRIVLMDMSLEAYLLANIRGGKPRLSYSMGLLNHLLSDRAEHRAIAADVEQENLSPMQRLLRLLTICFSLQNTLFFEIEQQRGPTNHLHRLGKQDFLNNPAARLCDVSAALELDISHEDAERAVTRSFRYNAKADGKVPFDAQSEATADDQYRHEFHEDLSKARDWNAENFPPLG